MLTLKEMIENEYPIPSYMADVFEKGPGWIETPQVSEESLLLLPADKLDSKIYAIDCEMVRGCTAGCRVADSNQTLVLDRRWQGTYPGLHDRI